MILETRSNWPFFEYEEGMEIQIAYLDDETNNTLVKQSTKIGFKRHQKTEETDVLELRRKIVRKTLVGWNLKNKHVQAMIEPSVEMTLQDGETWEDVFPFNEENKRLVVENLNWQFGEWVVGMAKDVAAYEAARKAREKQNLSPGSTSKEAKKN